MDHAPTDVFNPLYLRRAEDLQGFLLALLKGGLDKRARDMVGEIAAIYVTQRVGKHVLSPEGLTLDKARQKTVEALRQLGCTLIEPVFTSAEILEIETFIENKKVTFGASGFDEQGAKGEALASQLPANVRFGDYKTEDICKCTPIYRILHDRALIEIATSYLGAPPTISIATMWWSRPSSLPIGGMQMFHHDRGDFRSCNLFVYLTDVTEATGPHSFVTKTHETSILNPLVTERFGGDPIMLQKFWEWMEQHRKSDEDVYNFFREDEIRIFTGPKGMSFFEDTRGLHKATAPVLGPRLAFEIVYSTLPKLNEKVNPVPRNDLLIKNIDANSENIAPLVRYATRLMYK